MPTFHQNNFETEAAVVSMMPWFSLARFQEYFSHVMTSRYKSKTDSKSPGDIE